MLVVDDEPTIVEVVGRYMERAGYETHSAVDGPEALRLAGLHRPDLVVLDVMLPGFDGLEVMRRLHEGHGERTAVILLTARGEESDRLVGLRHGADDYVVKPFSPAELVARVEAVLRRVSPPPDAAPEPIEHGPLRIDPGARTVDRRRRGDLADPARVRPARLPRRPPRPRLLPRPADGGGLGIPLLHRHQHRHRPRAPPARQARRRPLRAPLHRDGVGRRLQAAAVIG